MTFRRQSDRAPQALSLMSKAFETRLTEHYRGAWSRSDALAQSFLMLPSACASFDRCCIVLKRKRSLRTMYGWHWYDGPLGEFKFMAADLLKAIFETQCFWPECVFELQRDYSSNEKDSSSGLFEEIRWHVSNHLRVGESLLLHQAWYEYLAQTAVCAGAVCRVVAEIDMRALRT